MAINGIKMTRNRINGFRRFHDRNTGETVRVDAPVFRKGLFGTVGGGTGAAAFDATNLWARDSAGYIWKMVDASTTGSPTVAVLADTPPGSLSLTTQATVNEASDLALTYGDELLLDPNKYLNTEFVLTPHTNLNNAAANRYGYIVGVIFGNWANSASTTLGPEGVSKRALVKLKGNAGATTLTLSADFADGTNTSTSTYNTTIAADARTIIRIDFTDLTDVKVMLNGSRILNTDATSTNPVANINMSALGATDYGQPIVASCRSATVIATAQVLYAESAAIWHSIA